jgi:FAD/FMN-containing dehydrogenase
MSAFHPLTYRSHGTLRRRDFLGSAAAAAASLASARLWASVADRRALPSELAAVSGDGRPVKLAAADLKDLEASLAGQLLLAQDAGYEQARRVWNGSIDRHPSLIVRCAGREDVVRAVQFARAHSLLTAVKGGGHSLSGQSTCDHGLMIDLTAMRAIQIDPTHRLARAQPGVLLAELDAKCQAAALVTTLGTASDTGIAGLTLGGGQGRLMRKLGLSCDNVRALELVTADGSVRRVSAEENPELFWALRGGGGNFGIVTEFEYQLHPLAHPVLAGGRLYPFSQARAVIRGLIDMAEQAPDELYLSVSIVNMAGEAGLPPGHYVAAELVHCGDPKSGERFLAPLDKLGKALSDTIAPKPYVVAQNGPTGAAPPALPAGLGVYIRSGFTRTPSERLIEEMVHAFEHGPPWLDECGLGPLGGAVARVAPEATAYWNRGAQCELILDGVWIDHTQDESNIAALRELWKSFEPFTEGYYVNTEPSAAERRLRATYGGNYTRLVQLKDRYDPTNLFRLNANIRPTAGA